MLLDDVVPDGIVELVVFDGPVLAAATAAAAAAANEDDEIVRDEGLKVADELPLDKPEERLESFECLLVLEVEECGF